MVKFEKQIIKWHASGLIVNKIHYLKKPVSYILLMLEFGPYHQISLPMSECGHWLNSATVRQKPLSLRPNKLLFTTGETQAGHCMSDEDPWVLINSEADTERAKEKIERVRAFSMTSVDKL